MERTAIVYLLGAGPGDPDLLARKAERNSITSARIDLRTTRARLHSDESIADGVTVAG